jgi:hypothetical protein
MSALGHKRTYAVQKGMSAFPPIATAKADMSPQMIVSALPRKRTCAAKPSGLLWAQEPTRSALPAYVRYRHNAARRACHLKVYAR